MFLMLYMFYLNLTIEVNRINAVFLKKRQRTTTFLLYENDPVAARLSVFFVYQTAMRTIYFTRLILLLPPPLSYYLHPANDRP